MLNLTLCPENKSNAVFFFLTCFNSVGSHFATLAGFGTERRGGKSLA